MRPTRLILLLIAGIALSGTTQGAISSFPQPPGSSEKNWVNVGVSIGAIIPRDADFWGWTADYTRVINDRWSLTGSLAFDRETENFSDKPKKVVDTYTLIGTVNYALTERWSLSTGLAKGIYDNDNPEGKVKFNWSDLSTGIAAGYSVSDRVGLSFAWEYNISQREPSVSVDLGIRFGF